MSLITYEAKTFNPEHTKIIERANAVCAEYEEQGLVLTLRQLYYQFVTRGWLPNKDSEYKRLGSICNDARMAGKMDWDHLIDRTRNLVSRPWWESPSQLVKQAAERYKPDLWKTQKRRVEVWIEKDAAIGVIENVCRLNDVPYFSCRGYTSVSEVHVAADRIRNHIEEGDAVTILHIGDHDPSGIDMTRDIEKRLRTFISRDWVDTWGRVQGLRGQVTRGQIKQSMRTRMREVGGVVGDYEDPWRLKRIALTYDQVEQYQPPPNPAKRTDSRYERYEAETGLDESWELDALDPAVLSNLIADEIDAIRNDDLWREAQDKMEAGRAALQAVSDNWQTIAETYTDQDDEIEGTD
jgi:hypothetical protein